MTSLASMTTRGRSFVRAASVLVLLWCTTYAKSGQYLSHPPLRRAPPPSKRARAKGPAYFADAVKGSDENEGTEASPWQSVEHALSQLAAGDTLYLRAGTYYECVYCAAEGREDAPITIRSYPGEQAIVDGGIPEFSLMPEKAWEPVSGGGSDEFRSIRSYKNIRAAIGAFGDSMIGLQPYWHAIDLRSTSQLWDSKGKDNVKPVYCGPGTWYDRATGHIHVRLSHTQLANPEMTNYRGETDPRKLPLVIAPFAAVPLLIDQARHVRFQDLIIRGGGYNTVFIRNGVGVEFDNVTVYCGTYGLRARNTSGLRFHNSALYGCVPPWGFRTETSLMTYPGRPNRRDIARLGTHALLTAEGGMECSVYCLPFNRDWELSYSEFTDGHDGLYLAAVDGLKFHHNVVDKMQDDGLYLSPMYIYASGKMQIYQNYFSRCLTAIGFGGPLNTRDDIYIFRNVFDLRAGTNSGRPSKRNPMGGMATGQVIGDHGSPPWPTMKFYYNTFAVRGRTVVGTHTHPDRPRHVFNNIFFHFGGLLGPQVPPPGNGQADGNLYWAPGTDPKKAAAHFNRYRGSKNFGESKKTYAPGFTANSLAADPKFVRADVNPAVVNDYRVSKGSPAVDAGVDIPADWPDTMRDSDKDKPDIGALPLGAPAFEAGRTGSPGAK